EENYQTARKEALEGFQMVPMDKRVEKHTALLGKTFRGEWSITLYRGTLDGVPAVIESMWCPSNPLLPLSRGKRKTYHFVPKDVAKAWTAEWAEKKGVTADMAEKWLKRHPGDPRAEIYEEVLKGVASSPS
ncbi:MAG TPA: hypothetical protein VH877_08460, partial [Polyangia bacterium]|nr:hypothetical protein [Polyangia bacterium]